MTLPDRIPGQYLAHLPISPDGNRIGFWTKRQQRQERRQSRGLNSAQRRYLQQGETFLLSYKQDSNKTLGMWRDFLIAQAIFTSLTNSQYQTADQSQLTPFASKFWKLHSTNSFWNQKRDLRDYYYAGTLGTVGFSLLDTDPLSPGTDILDVIQEQQRLFWKRLDLHEVSIEQKYPDMIRRMSFSPTEVKILESNLLGLFDLNFNQENYDLAQILRQKQITRGEVSRLDHKIPRLKISFELIQAIKIIEQNVSLQFGSDWLVEQLVKFIRLCPPGGLDLFLLALAVEAYTDLVLLVERFDLSQPLLEWEQTIDSNTFNRYVSYIALIRDCFSLVTSLQFLEPSRIYLSNLLHYYGDLNNNEINFSMRLKDDNSLNNNQRELRPFRGDTFILVSISPYYRYEIRVEVEFEDFEQVYISDLKGNFDPITIRSSPSEINIIPNRKGDHLIVVADQIVNSISDLDSVNTHSAVKEISYLDQQTTYIS